MARMYADRSELTVNWTLIDAIDPIMEWANRLQQPEFVWMSSVYTIRGRTLVLTAKFKVRSHKTNPTNGLGNLLFYNPCYVRLPYAFDLAHFEQVPVNHIGAYRPASEPGNQSLRAISITSHEHPFCVICEKVGFAYPYASQDPSESEEPHG
jgi:hypothetical protein